MKNIHILPTDKPSRLFKHNNAFFIEKEFYESTPRVISQNIYITSDKEIKEGDWITNGLTIMRANLDGQPTMDDYHPWNKIILTTDQDLIKDGVQAIDDEFLEWFIKNPSCEEIKIDKKENLWFCCDFFEEGQEKYCINSMPRCPKCNAALGGSPDWTDYKIIIPKPTQQIIDEDFNGGLTMGQIISKEENKKYPIGGYAPGNYMCKCSICKTQFQGDKKAVQCESCAIKTIEESKQETICIQTGLPCGMTCFSKEVCNRNVYTEEDVKNAFLDGWQLRDGDLPFPKAKKKWFNEFKNK